MPVLQTILVMLSHRFMVGSWDLESHMLSLASCSVLGEVLLLWSLSFLVFIKGMAI